MLLKVRGVPLAGLYLIGEPLDAVIRIGTFQDLGFVARHAGREIRRPDFIKVVAGSAIAWPSSQSGGRSWRSR
jgi:hypothetical protein